MKNSAKNWLDLVFVIVFLLLALALTTYWSVRLWIWFIKWAVRQP